MRVDRLFCRIVTLFRLGTIAGLCVASLLVGATLTAEPPAAPIAEEKLTKLPGTFGNDVMESTPLVYRGRRIIFHSRRPIGTNPALDEHYLYLKDMESGKESARFGRGHSLGSAFVEGDTLHVFAAQHSGNDWFHDINHFSSTDMKTWKRELAVPRIGGEHLLNSSVCRDEQGYLMAYESDKPVKFCFKFARSKDLAKWEKIDGLVFAGVSGKEYSACPVIRYFKPYYYAIYLHAAIPGHNGWVSFLARSKDLAAWQLSPKNPILEAGEGEGCNNSDVDLIEIDGKTYVYYGTGDQQTWLELKRAVYPGPMKEFLESYFPEGGQMTEVSARVGPTSEAPLEVLRKAAHVTPTPQQLLWQEMEFTCFVHFGMSTFTDKGFGGWGDGTDAPELFNPTAFNADQWVSACRDAGMKMLILTCKHHNGFCLWPSKHTEYSVKNSPWRNGKGDVVKEVADACRRGGIKFGIYLSPWDQHEKTYGTDAYNDFYKNQLRELLANYGEIAEVWWDGACGEGPNGKRQVYDWEGYIKTVRQLQPNALAAIMGPDIRWVGNEVGLARESEWSVLPKGRLGDANDPKYQMPDLGNRKYLVGAKELFWYPAECCVSIRPNWFYLANEDGQVKSLKHLLDIYYRSVGLNSVLLLNVPPDRGGLFHENDVARLHELRATLDETFRTNLAAGKSARASSAAAGHDAAMAVDGNGVTYWTPADGVIQASLEIDLGQPVVFDRAMLQEMVATGQRVEGFKLEAWDGQTWKEFAKATTIGYKRLLRFQAVTASKVRLTIFDARDCPTIREFGLFQASTRESE